RRQLELHKMNMYQQAQYEVDAYENLIEVLSSVHKDCGPVWDWDQIAKQPAPSEPKRSTHYESIARAALDSYEPTRSDKLFRRVESKRAELEDGITRARERDDLEYNERLREYRERYEEWETNREIATAIF